MSISLRVLLLVLVLLACYHEGNADGADGPAFRRLLRGIQGCAVGDTFKDEGGNAVKCRYVPQGGEPCNPKKSETTICSTFYCGGSSGFPLDLMLGSSLLHVRSGKPDSASVFDSSSTHTCKSVFRDKPYTFCCPDCILLGGCSKGEGNGSGSDGSSGPESVPATPQLEDPPLPPVDPALAGLFKAEPKAAPSPSLEQTDAGDESEDETMPSADGPDQDAEDLGDSPKPDVGPAGAASNGEDGGMKPTVSDTDTPDEPDGSDDEPAGSPEVDDFLNDLFGEDTTQQSGKPAADAMAQEQQEEEPGNQEQRSKPMAPDYPMSDMLVDTGELPGEPEDDDEASNAEMMVNPVRGKPPGAPLVKPVLRVPPGGTIDPTTWSAATKPSAGSGGGGPRSTPGLPVRDGPSGGPPVKSLARMTDDDSEEPSDGSQGYGLPDPDDSDERTVGPRAPVMPVGNPVSSMSGDDADDQPSGPAYDAEDNTAAESAGLVVGMPPVGQPGKPMLGGFDDDDDDPDDYESGGSGTVPSPGDGSGGPSMVPPLKPQPQGRASGPPTASSILSGLFRGSVGGGGVGEQPKGPKSQEKMEVDPTIFKPRVHGSAPLVGDELGPTVPTVTAATAAGGPRGPAGVVNPAGQVSEDDMGVPRIPLRPLGGLAPSDDPKTYPLGSGPEGGGIPVQPVGLEGPQKPQTLVRGSRDASPGSPSLSYALLSQDSGQKPAADQEEEEEEPVLGSKEAIPILELFGG